MTDIKKSLLAGIQSAKDAFNNINEIHSVLNATSNIIKEISDGNATLGVGSFFEKNENDSPFASSLAIMASAYGQDKRRKYKALAIFDKDGKYGEEIAEWTQHENGYPCSITFNTSKLYCSNKEELQSALSELLKETKTGKAILSKMQN